MNFYKFKVDLRFWLVLVIVFVIVFDSHLEAILGLEGFILGDLLLIGLTFFLLLREILRGKINRSVFVYLLFILLTFLLSLVRNSLPVALLGTYYICKIFVAYIFGILIGITVKQANFILKFLLIVAIVSALISILDFLFGQPVMINFLSMDRKVTGSPGLFVHPNKNAIFLVTSFFLVPVFFRKQKLLQIGISSLIIGAILLSQSRQSLVAFAVALALYFILKKRYLLLVVGAIAGAVFFFLFRDTIFHRFDEISLIIETGEYFRLYAFIIVLELISHFPWFGVGAGMFGGVIANRFDSIYHYKYYLYDYFIGKITNEEYWPTTIDMYWPHLLAEIGIIGFVIYIGLVGKIFLKLKQIFNKTNSLLYLALICILVVQVMFGFFSTNMEATFITLLTFMLFGIYSKKADNILF